MSTMQKVLLAGALAALLLRSGAGLFGYYRLWPRIQAGSTKAVELEVAFQVERSMENALVKHKRDPCAVTLAGHDLDISSYTDTTGESGVEIVNSDAAIINGLVEVTSNGIDIYMADLHLHGVPAVQDGAFELTDTDVDHGITSLLINKSALETSFERGVNAGLASVSLIPISVETRDGSMTIACEDASETSASRASSRIQLR
jgi:hypothetical protein